MSLLAAAVQKGGGHDVRRFSTRQDASSKNPGHASDGRCEVALTCFLSSLSFRKERDPRASAEKDSGLSRKKIRSLAFGSR